MVKGGDQVEAINQIINQETSSSMRATVLSAGGFGFSIVYIIFGPLFGFCADKWDFPAALLYLGIVIFILGLAAAVYIIKNHPRTLARPDRHALDSMIE